MFRLHVMDTADVFVLVGQLSEPRASFYVIMGNRGNPDIIYKMGSKLNR